MSLLQELNNELAGVATQALKSVVQVRDGVRGVGAGAVWHANEGGSLIITNAHVVRGAAERQQMEARARQMYGQRYGRGFRMMMPEGKLEVALAGGRVLPARIIARDDERDLAALQVDATDLPTIEPGNSSALQAGEWVFALGHPWGVQNVVTGGVVIRVGSGLAEMPQVQGDFVITDLQLRPGNSGGPLVDSRGRMIGVATLMNGPEVGVAVSIDTVKAFLKRALGAEQQQRPAVTDVPVTSGVV